jgi:hypothetical protein
MRTVLFLNRWNYLFHLMLTKVDGEQSRRLEGRFCRSLGQTRKVMTYWRAEYDVDDDDVHDNSDVDLDILFAWMDFDLEHDAHDVAQ